MQADEYTNSMGVDNDPALYVAVLDEHWVMSLATIEGSAPYTTPVFYAALRQGRWLAFYSKRTSRHINNATSNPRAAASIYRETRQPGVIQGLQLTGNICAVSDSNKREVKKAYLCAHPLAAVVLATVRDIGLYILEVYEATLTDSARLGFGRKIVWNFCDHKSECAKSN